jgi:hypothetical protein
LCEISLIAHSKQPTATAKQQTDNRQKTRTRRMLHHGQKGNVQCGTWKFTYPHTPSWKGDMRDSCQFAWGEGFRVFMLVTSSKAQPSMAVAPNVEVKKGVLLTAFEN